MEPEHEPYTIKDKIADDAKREAAFRESNLGVKVGGRKRRREKNKIGEPFVAILKYMIKCPAFLELSNPSRVAYILLKSQTNKANQTEVRFPYSDAEKYMDRKTFTKAIRELKQHGFIEVSSSGGLYRRTNIFRFIEAWRNHK